MRTLFASILLLYTASVFGGDSNSLMDLSTDGRLLACSNRDSGSVSIVDLTLLTKTHEVPVGAFPEGVSFLGDSHQLAVAVYGDDAVALLDADSGEVIETIAVEDEPYAIVTSPNGDKLWVTLEYPGKLIEIDPQARTIVNAARVGSFVRGLALTAGDQLLVTQYFTGVVNAVDPRTLKVTDTWTGSAQDNLARQIAVHPRREKAYIPHQRSMVMSPQGTGSIFPYASVVDTAPGEGKRRKRIQMDSFRGTYVVANPWEISLSPDGERLYIVFSGTDDMFVCDIIDDDYRELEIRSLVRTGANPRAVRVAPDNQSFFVYNALDFTVDVFETANLTRVATIPVTTWPGAEEELLGKKLFYSARPPMSTRRWISCSSCHPDGDSDGRTWQQPEGLRETQPLFGLKQTHPVHWSADRDEVQDFEHTIRSPLMQGRGLIRGPVHDSLGSPNAGLSRELDALAAYTNSHTFRLSPHGKDGLSKAARRGRDLFFSSETGCARCHSGAYYTDRKMHDVGTGTADSSEKLGPEYDTPTLLGIYRSGPYLHHGQARTLIDLLTIENPHDKHGRTSHLNPEEVRDLVEFLKALPFETPRAAN